MSNKIHLKVPAHSWDVMAETLAMDSESSSFDPDLRRQISEALQSVEVVDEPLSYETEERQLLEALYHQLGTDSDLEQVSNPEAYRGLCLRLRDVLTKHDSPQVVLSLASVRVG